MKKSLLIAYLVIVFVPLACVSWLGWRSIGVEQARYQSQLRDLQQERLQEFSNNQQRWLESLETSLIQFLESVRNEPYSSWPDLQEQNRFTVQLFSVDPDGQLAWPSESVLPLSQGEIHFRDLYQQGIINLSLKNDESGKVNTYFNWSAWFEGQGQQWAAWIYGSDGEITGMVLDRTAFISEAIAQLPDQLEISSGPYHIRQESLKSGTRESSEQFTLVNETGEILYSWGADLSGLNQAFPIEVQLPSPLNMWRIQLITIRADRLPFYRQPMVFFLGIGLSGLFLITLIAAYYLYSETRREFQQARQRVSFVNQVSHEFKTPLTNIQIYSDLLEDEITDGQDNKHLNIIREESSKLNRMIQNVLTFGRSQRACLQLNPVSIVPDKHIEEQLELHQPGLKRMKNQVDFDPGASLPMLLDPECINQILGNLLSNAGKYAPGSDLHIQTRQSGNRLVVVVQDSGPGIAKSRQESVFEPFIRLENATTEGVSGTGIGLSIARDLARLHGGDLVLEPSDSGARFVFNLVEPS